MTRQPSLQPGDTIRGVEVLEITGAGKARRCKLRCTCEVTFTRAYGWVMEARRNGTELACNECNRAKQHRKSTLWTRRRRLEAER